MKDLKKFVKTEDSKKQAEKEAKDCGMNIPKEEMDKADNIKSDDVNFVKNLVGKYKNNKEMLVNDIVKLAAKNKKEGKIDDNQLNNIEEKLSPMLNDKQKQMLKNIMGMIKD